MAKGDCTITKVFTDKPVFGGHKHAFFTLAPGTNHYKTGGFTCDLTAYGLGTIRLVELPSCVLGYIPVYDATNKKLIFYTGAAGINAELADDSAALNSQTIQFGVHGTGS